LVHKILTTFFQNHPNNFIINLFNFKLSLWLILLNLIMMIRLVGHLATPITSSAVTRAIKKIYPYRFGLTPLLRGLEIGLAHGYFNRTIHNIDPLRNSDIGLLAGFLQQLV
jgi:hypothetical protein